MNVTMHISNTIHLLVEFGPNMPLL